MVDLHLEQHEAEDLRDILSNTLSDLKMEISNTESLDWRKSLKEREVLLKRLIVQPGPVPATPA